jgi:hypothetical protein
MEHGGRKPVATAGKWGRSRKRLKQAKSSAVGCDRLPKGAHGKEAKEGVGAAHGRASQRARMALLARNWHATG